MTDTNVLSDFLANQVFVAFDTETTGIWAPANKIVEIGAVKFKLSTDDTETFQQLIDPGRPMPPEVIKIHGITDEMVAGAPDAISSLAAFLEFCGPDSILIAHNAAFDASFVGCELNREGQPIPTHPILDTVEIFRKNYPGLSSYSLLSLARDFKIGETQSHRALADAQMVRSIFSIAAEKFADIADIDQLKKAMTIYKINDCLPHAADLPRKYLTFAAAAENRSRLRISYKSQNSMSSSRIIQARTIYQLGPHYYLSAFCERVQEERTFRLDRIDESEVIDSE